MQIPAAAERKKKWVHSWVLFVRNLCRERLQNVVHSVCGQKAITARKLLTPSDYTMSFKKKKKSCTDFTSHAEHTSASVGSLRRNPDIHAHHLPQSPPSLSPTAGFILSAGTMTGEEKRMLSPLAGQQQKNIHANETFLMSPGLKWHFYDMKSQGNKMLLCLVALERQRRRFICDLYTQLAG